MVEISLAKGRKVVTPWMDIDEAAEYCRMTRSTFIRKTGQSQIPYGGDEKNRRYHAKEVDRWLKGLTDNT